MYIYTEIGYQSPVAFLHLFNLIVKSGFLSVESYENPSFLTNTSTTTYIDIPSIICAEETIEADLAFDFQNAQISHSDNFSYEIAVGVIIIDPIEPVGDDTDGWIEFALDNNDVYKANSTYIFNFTILEGGENMGTYESVDVEFCNITIHPTTQSSLIPDKLLEIVDYSVSPEYLGGLSWFDVTTDMNGIKIGFNLDVLELAGIPVPSVIEYKVIIQSPCGDLRTVTSELSVPDCNLDPTQFRKIHISPNPTGDTDFTVAIETLENSTMQGAIYLRSANGLTLIDSDYRSSSVPLVISSAMVGTGINYVSFTDHQTFSFSEEIIRFR